MFLLKHDSDEATVSFNKSFLEIKHPNNTYVGDIWKSSGYSFPFRWTPSPYIIKAIPFMKADKHVSGSPVEMTHTRL